MEPLRLDPADPFASVLAWLAALAQALGIDPSRIAPKVQLNRAAASVVRGWLADWSRQLRGVIAAEAARLAATLKLKPRSAAVRAQADAAHPRAKAGRVVAVAAPGSQARRPQEPARPGLRRDRAELIDQDEDAALRLRTRAVLMALRDPSAAVRRLALTLARRAAGARTVHRRRFPRPPAVVVRDFALSRAPELRPPNGAAAVCMQHALRLPAAASQALGNLARVESRDIDVPRRLPGSAKRKPGSRRTWRVVK